jgi:uncharacterized membrane protein
VGEGVSVGGSGVAVSSKAGVLAEVSNPLAAAGCCVAGLKRLQDVISKLRLATRNNDRNIIKSPLPIPYARILVYHTRLAFLTKQPIIHLMKGNFVSHWIARLDVTQPDRKIRWIVYGVALLLLFGWLLNTPEGLLGKADAVGYAVCHRIDLRSFHIGDRALPLCARCSGMYLGAVVGLIYQGIVGRRQAGMPGKSVLVVFGLFVGAFGMDGLNSYFHLFPGFEGVYQPQNLFRLITGTGMGLVVAGLVFPAFNQTIWRNWNSKPILPTLWHFLPMVFAAILLDLILLTDNPIILYPLALISASGVIVLLTMIYSMLTLVVLRKENQFENYSQMAVILIVGFTIALTQIAALDFVRFLFTGSWDGFHLG